MLFYSMQNTENETGDVYFCPQYSLQVLKTFCTKAMQYIQQAIYFLCRCQAFNE